MPTHILSLDDDTLLVILRKAGATKPAHLEDALLVCKRFRDVLLAAATSVTVTCDNPALLRHAPALRSMTLAYCSRLPWAQGAHGRTPCIAPSDLSHLSSLTRIDAGAARVGDDEMAKLPCLPMLAHLRTSRSLRGAGLAHLPEIPSLRHLDLSGSREIEREHAEHLLRLTFLESLDLRNYLSGDSAVGLVTALKSLTRVEFSLNMHWRDGEEELSGEAIAGLATLSNLRFLDLRRAVEGGLPELSQLSALRALETLDLSENSIGMMTHTDVAFLSCLTNLRTLRLYANGPDLALNDALAHVAQLTQLTQLTMDSNCLDDTGLRRLTRLKALERLDLEGSKISEDGLSCLRHLSSLRAINVAGFTQVPLVAVFGSLTALESLQRVDTGDMDDAAFAQLCQLTALTCLALQPGVTTKGRSHLTNLRALQALDLSECEEGLEETLAHVAALTALTQLQLTGSSSPGLTDEALARLSTLRKLQCLEVEGCDELTDRGLTVLKGFSCLTSLRVAGCGQITGQASTAITSLQALSRLSLCECPQVSIAGLGHLSKLTGLTELSLHGCERVDGCVLGQVRRLRKLTVLDLSACEKISDKGLSSLVQLSRLQELNLSGIPLTDGGMAHVARISTLTKLDLADCERIGGEGLVQLTKLTRLEWLCAEASRESKDRLFEHLQDLAIYRPGWEEAEQDDEDFVPQAWAADGPLPR